MTHSLKIGGAVILVLLAAGFVLTTTSSEKSTQEGYTAEQKLAHLPGESLADKLLAPPEPPNRRENFTRTGTYNVKSDPIGSHTTLTNMSGRNDEGVSYAYHSPDYHIDNENRYGDHNPNSMVVRGIYDTPARTPTIAIKNRDEKIRDNALLANLYRIRDSTGVTPEEPKEILETYASPGIIANKEHLYHVPDTPVYVSRKYTKEEHDKFAQGKRYNNLHFPYQKRTVYTDGYFDGVYPYDTIL